MGFFRRSSLGKGMNIVQCIDQIRKRNRGNMPIYNGICRTCGEDSEAGQKSGEAGEGKP
jgi:hypothetical protein